MQNEATNAITERLLNNKHLATRIRRSLLEVKGKAKQPYGPDDPFVRILNDLTDEQLICKYIARGVVKRVEAIAP